MLLLPTEANQECQGSKCPLTVNSLLQSKQEGAVAVQAVEEADEDYDDLNASLVNADVQFTSAASCDVGYGMGPGTSSCSKSDGDLCTVSCTKLGGGFSSSHSDVCKAFDGCQTQVCDYFCPISLNNVVNKDSPGKGPYCSKAKDCGTAFWMGGDGKKYACYFSFAKRKCALNLKTKCDC